MCFASISPKRSLFVSFTVIVEFVGTILALIFVVCFERHTCLFVLRFPYTPTETLVLYFFSFPICLLMCNIVHFDRNMFAVYLTLIWPAEIFVSLTLVVVCIKIVKNTSSLRFFLV